MSNRIWKRSDTFSAQICVAHYGEDDLDESCFWTLRDEQGKVVAQGELPKGIIKQGGLRTLGDIQVCLFQIVGNQHLTLHLQVGKYSNDYPIWVYDTKDRNGADNHRDKEEMAKSCSSKKLLVTTEWNQKTMRALERGRNVLLVADTTSLQNTVDAAFITDFWCYPMFKKYGPPGTMGLLIDASHGVFGRFPTASHSDWQWWRMARNSPVMNLGKLPSSLRPTVQVIDNFATNRHLGLLFEANVGKGHLVVTSINLLQEQYPEIVALRESIMEYMLGGKFEVSDSLGIEELSQLFK